jgi:hypothetical protein
MAPLRYRWSDVLTFAQAMAKRLWDRRIYPVVKRRIKAGDFAPDGTLLVTTMEIGG